MLILAPLSRDPRLPALEPLKTRALGAIGLKHEFLPQLHLLIHYSLYTIHAVER